MNASRTAVAVGMLRALHRRVDAQPWITNDTVSSRLFGADVETRLRSDAAWWQDPRQTALRGHVLVRSAFAEDRLRQAVRRGVRQCVILGAGFDTLAYRQPEWLAAVRLFEVDTPATQAAKLERLAGAGIVPPGNVVFAAVDFERTALGDALSAAGFDPSAAAFFSWLGVTVYLTLPAIAAVLRYVGALAAGSEIAFTYTQPDPAGSGVQAEKLAALGEPMRTRLTPDEVEAMLAECGFGSVTRLTVDGARAFLGDRHDALTVPAKESIIAAIV